MLNHCAFIGRLTDLPAGGETQSGSSFARFTVAVERNYKNSDGDYDSDFISCSAFGKTADYIMTYAGKGDLVSVAGQIQNNNYTDKEGTKHYNMRLNAREVSVLSHPKKSEESRRHFERQQKQSQTTSRPQQTTPQSTGQQQSLGGDPWSNTGAGKKIQNMSEEPPLPPEPPINQDDGSINISDDDLPFD